MVNSQWLIANVELPAVSQVAALQRLPPFQINWLISFSFNSHSLHLNENNRRRRI